MLSRTRFFVLILFLLSICALGCGGGSDFGGLTPAVDDGDSLASGRTVGTSGELVALEGTAIPYADIYVDDELVGFTDEDGSYSLDIEPGEHSIAFGYDDIIFHETIVDSNSRQVMQYPQPPQTGVVAGRVFGKPLNSPDPPDGGDENDEFEPLKNAIVLVIDKDRRWMGADITDEQGRYRVAHAPAGESILIVFHRGYLPWSFHMFINPNTVQFKDVYLMRAPHWGHLLGLVRDPEFHPIGHVGIVLTHPNETEPAYHGFTTDFGVFFINRIEPGPYMLHARKLGYEPFDRPVLIDRGRNFVRFKMFPVNDDPPGGGDE
jgi:hypothetical protein